MRNTSIAFLALLMLLGAAPQTHVDHPGLRKLAWQQAAGASTFREMTTFDMIDLLHEMDVHHIELAPGQTLSADKKNAKIGPEMSDADSDALMAKLKEVKMDIVSYGIADFGVTPDSAKKVFEFGKKLKLKTIVTDAPPESLEMLDKLATEYQINVALTSATTARRYVACDTALEAIKGRSDHIGLCADLAAWKSAGQDPVDCIKKLDGHVMLVDLNDIDASGKPVALGAGKVDYAAALTVLRDQKFKGIFCVQDDSESPSDRLAGFAKSVNAFSVVVTTLAK
jgi:sugar phosphate isomerase/epimerase